VKRSKFESYKPSEATKAVIKFQFLIDARERKSFVKNRKLSWEVDKQSRVKEKKFSISNSMKPQHRKICFMRLEIQNGKPFFGIIRESDDEFMMKQLNCDLKSTFIALHMRSEFLMFNDIAKFIAELPK
jgi:hypothetical protein